MASSRHKRYLADLLPRYWPRDHGFLKGRFRASNPLLRIALNHFHRSYLFVPGNRPDRFTKACASGADVVIVDLEDAVPPAAKEQARESVGAWLDASQPVMVRINGVETPWFEEDCALSKLSGIVGVMLPKAARPQDVAEVAGKLRVPVLPLIETALGFRNVQGIASTPGVQRLVFGSIDFQLDMDITGEDAELLVFRSGIVLASRLAGLVAPIDGVCTSIDDHEILRDDARRSRRQGFGAKLCIHPRQVAAVHAAFSPSKEEIAWAAKVLAAVESAGGAVVAVDAKMIDRPVMLRAQAIIDRCRSAAL